MFINPVLTFCFDLVRRVQNARDKGQMGHNKIKKKKGGFLTIKPDFVEEEAPEAKGKKSNS